MDGCRLDQGGERHDFSSVRLAHVNDLRFYAGHTQHRQYNLDEPNVSQSRLNLFRVTQCGPGPTEEACRLDGGEQYAECPEYEASCDEMQAEYQWLDRMSLEDSIP